MSVLHSVLLIDTGQLENTEVSELEFGQILKLEVMGRLGTVKHQDFLSSLAVPPHLFLSR